MECDFEIFIYCAHESARRENRDLFCALVAVTPGETDSAMPDWRVACFNTRQRNLNYIIGADSFVYFNVSKRLDHLRKPSENKC
jgi:hypothetical protein